MQRYIVEICKTVRLAIPMIVGLIGQMALEMIDMAMIGRVGVTPLAAAGFGGTINGSLLLFGAGLCIPVHVLMAQAYGAGKVKYLGPILGHSIWVILGFSSSVAIGLHIGIDGLDWFGQVPAVADAAKPYTQLLAWSIIPSLFYQCLKNCFEALNRPWVPFNILVLGLFTNVFLNWILIFGNLGFPALGLEGAGIATLVTRSLMLVGLGAIMFYLYPGFKLEHEILFISKIDISLIKKILAIGLPGAMQIIFQAGAFYMATFMMGWINENALAAHQIVLKSASLLFMIPLGISFGISIRIGQAAGRGDSQSIKAIGFSGISFAGMLMGLIGIAFFFLRYQVAELFINDQTVVDIAAQLLVLVAFIQIFDSVHIACLGALRGLADVKIAALFLLIIFWGISLPMGYWLAFYFNLDALGVWLGLTCGLVLAALVLIARFSYVIKERRA